MSVSLQVDPDELRQLIRAIATELLAQVEADRMKLNGNGKLCYTEAEAAELLGLREHQLRDERRRERIGASVIVGRRVRYSREDLLAYLARRRIAAQPERQPAG